MEEDRKRVSVRVMRREKDLTGCWWLDRKMEGNRISKCRQPLKARKDKKTNSSIERPKRNAAP